MDTIKILLVDDEPGILSSLEKLLLREGYTVFTADTGERALEVIKSEDIDLILTDLRLPDFDGIELIKLVKKFGREPEIILMTAFGSVETAVNAMKMGAYDFITKPVKKAQLMKTISKALEKHSLVKENMRLKSMLRSESGTQKMTGTSDAFRKMVDLINSVAKSNATVLLQGESGTGKELASRAIHDASNRSDRPFVILNCGALPETIIESELFGYTKGAFTGADKDRMGKIRQADGGTLFLDEIGELKPSLQVKLLRVLQEGIVEPVGSDSGFRVNFRLICATHRDLKKMVAEGTFREDLFYRLNVICITVPPLRDRLDDIPLLCASFIKKFNAKNSKNIRGIDHDALEILLSWPWGGNVRELENIIERAVVLTRTDFITTSDLPPELTHEPAMKSSLSVPIGVPLEEIELKIIRETLKFTDGNKASAARLLGITTRTIYRKLSEEDETENGD
ncbi:sigma-54 dependent transcriptional regulator [Myxococcota bacterium]|nr:sigma-54 dependent transcriptional regulator [Myxococcota bacterium]MBU1380641.1 sigma-54 dependent transcriptional regulator [Myxococcota bacterium]MBU1496983.1 sigma-54 dependent transcriptional regulator [Myxococcota bacterium]